MKAQELHDWIRTYYGQKLASSSDLKTDACCAAGAPPAWLRELLRQIHPDVVERFYGCGFPIPEGLTGRSVVDLGCGTGRDVYLLAQLVGPEGRVLGVDMTEEQLAVARRTVGWHAERFGHETPNVVFHQGYIEQLDELPVEAASVDVVVSNCVVNLSPRKDLVVAGAARLLRHGGELYFSDVFADRRLAADVSADPILYAECLGGAMYLPDFLSLARKHGFPDPRVVSSAPIELADEIEKRVGAARFHSVTLRLFKLPELEERCEDYGQVATYLGDLGHVGPCFRLDEHHLFEAGRPERVCGNTADMLAQSRFAPHFEVAGDKSNHFGSFDCAATMAQQVYGARTTLGRQAEGEPKPTASCC